MKWVKCPIEKCETAYMIGTTGALHTQSEEEALFWMELHVLEYHSVNDLKDFIVKQIKIVEEDE